MFLVPLTRNANEISRSFDKLFDDGFFDRFFAPATAAGEPGTRSPALDVAETDREYTVTLDMPGITKDDVQVAIDGRRVSIEARTRTEEEKKDGDRLIYRERASTRYARSFTLPQEVDQTASSAKLDHGVLKLTLAKRSATAAARLQVN
jgi:HSP20 family protein